VTVTTPSTTSALDVPADFEIVNGGIDQACRGSGPGDTSETYYTVFAGKSNLRRCAAECTASPSNCMGIEYNALYGRCEVWHEPIQATQQVKGYSCYRYFSSQTTTPVTAHASCGQLFESCGGDDHYQGTQCCVSGLKCERLDADYSQCKKDTSSGYQCAQLHEQCGGIGWAGAMCCAEGLHCVVGNSYFSQCLKKPGSLLQVQDDGVEVSQLRGPRLRKSRKQSSLESKPWFVQKCSHVTSLKATHKEAGEEL
jgi:hypothetical protein